MTDVHERIREFWDRDSHTYDDSSSHSVSDPLEAAAWRAALRRSLPDAGASILDVGAGTGALSILAAELGYHVTALDLSEGMLAKARAKAEVRQLDITFVVGQALEPPAGPFDAVIERHVVWTMPDPVAVLRAWHDVVTPGGRLVLFEGVWKPATPSDRMRVAAAEGLRKVRRNAAHHHAPYPDDVMAQLPLAGMSSPAPLIDAVHQAGWHATRVERLRDIEWAVQVRERWPLGRLEHTARYVLIADA